MLIKLNVNLVWSLIILNINESNLLILEYKYSCINIINIKI